LVRGEIKYKIDAVPTHPVVKVLREDHGVGAIEAHIGDDLTVSNRPLDRGGASEPSMISGRNECGRSDHRRNTTRAVSGNRRHGEVLVVPDESLGVPPVFSRSPAFSGIGVLRVL
jgi:hypothetical protein